jgi:hypothetical protein
MIDSIVNRKETRGERLCAWVQYIDEKEQIERKGLRKE